jgi:hypothetical protein
VGDIGGGGGGQECPRGWQHTTELTSVLYISCEKAIIENPELQSHCLACFDEPTSSANWIQIHFLKEMVQSHQIKMTIDGKVEKV